LNTVLLVLLQLLLLLLGLFPSCEGWLIAVLLLGLHMWKHLLLQGSCSKQLYRAAAAASAA
jgi:hypothetical protein